MAAGKTVFLSLLLQMVFVATSDIINSESSSEHQYINNSSKVDAVETADQNNRFPMVLSDNKLYYIEHILKADFYQAWYYCKSHGMDLLSLETEEEVNSVKMALKKQIEKFGPSNEPIFFVAGRHIDDANTWIWMDSGKPFVKLPTKVLVSGNGMMYRDDNACVVFQYHLPIREINLRSANCNVDSHFICRDKNAGK